MASASQVSGPSTSDEITRDKASPNSTSPPSNAILTPDLDSDDSDLEIDGEELGKSFKLQHRRRDAEKSAEGDDDEDEDEADDGGYRDSGRRRGSASTVQSYQLYTPDEERAVVRKFDRKLVLFVALLYMLSFLDRSSMLTPQDWGYC